MRWTRLLMLVAAAGATATAAAGMGGGGGGMGEAPSASAPAYDPAAEYAKAVAAIQAKQYRDAARAAGHVIQVTPDDPDGWRLLGVAKAGLLDWKGSRRAYERTVKLAPDDATAHAGLGLALANLKDPKAQGELDWLTAKRQACAAACPDAAQLDGLIAAVRGALAGAPASSPSAAIDGSLLFAGPAAGDAAYASAVGLINQHRYDDALKALADAQAVFGPHPDIITYQGYVWRKKGDYARAESYYRKALAIAPHHRGATEYYGELKVERGDLAGARVMLARLERQCAFGCAEAEELRRWIAAGREPRP